MIEKSISKLEAIVDSNVKNLDIFEFDADSVIIFLCQIFERRVKELKKFDREFNKIIPIELSSFGFNISISVREKIMDEHEALSLLIREVIQNNNNENILKDVNREIVNITNEAFNRAVKQVKAEALFTSMHQNLFDGQVISKELGKETMRFTYKTTEIAEYEAINALIINDYNKVKQIQYESPEELGIKRFNTWTFIKIKSNALRWMDMEFQFPNDFQVGPYKIREIKEIWTYVITKAYIEYYTNLNKDWPTLMELNYEDWRYTYASKEKAQKLINDLTYRGHKNKENAKTKSIYTTLLTEPIIEVKGKKLISPTLILNYQASRNIISTLNRIYEGHPLFDASMHADRKEDIFISELLERLSIYSNLRFSKNIRVRGSRETNVDFLIYDKSTKTLGCFELKWLNEPVTAVEIKNKDEELKKGISIQLPNYEKGINKNIDEFMLKGFKERYEVKEISFFVLTKGTIGSGKINREKYHIINQRMLEKALGDVKGNLQNAIKNLKDGDYLPKSNVHFELISDIEIKVGNVMILSDGYKVIKPYSLD